MDASHFEDLDKSLSGSMVINKLSDNFEILDRFKVLVHNLPSLSLSSNVELEVLMKEMTNQIIPTNEQWKQVYRLGRSKYKFN